MEIKEEKLKSIGVAMGSILGFIVILAGIAMTILILLTMFQGE